MRTNGGACGSASYFFWCSWLIASVAREPLWRALNLARLSYVGDLGNTPGHLNHWSRHEFVRFLESRFEVVEVRSPPP